MSELRDLLSAEAERQRPAWTPPYAEIARRAHRRSRLRAAAAGSAVVAVVTLAAISSALLTGSDDDQTRSGPAGPSVSTTPSGPSIPTISGPRTLGAPIEVRQVLRPPETCRATAARAFTSAAGNDCFELAAPEIVVRHVADLSVVEVASPDGTLQGDQAVWITLDDPDAAQLTALTADRWDGERVAFVVGGLVYDAPTIQGQPLGHMLQLSRDPRTIERLLDVLTATSG
jgi:hypothetical protein